LTEGKHTGDPSINQGIWNMVLQKISGEWRKVGGAESGWWGDCCGVVFFTGSILLLLIALFLGF